MNVKAHSKIITSPHYGEILKEYNKVYARDGKVNNLKFYREVISRLVPEYKQRAWYDFVNKFKSVAGLMANGTGETELVVPGEQERELIFNFAADKIATSQGINKALNFGTVAIEKLVEKFSQNPESLTTRELLKMSDFLFKAMKAQDSRIHALGKVNEEKREDMKMQRAFDNAFYE